MLARLDSNFEKYTMNTLHIVETKKFICPIFFCYVCGCSIEDASRGNVIFGYENLSREEEDGTITYPFVTVHKDCESARTHDDFPYAMDLDTALIYLLNSSGMTKERMQRAREKVEMLSKPVRNGWYRTA